MTVYVCKLKLAKINFLKKIDKFRIHNSGQIFLNSGQIRNAGLNLVKIEKLQVKCNIAFMQYNDLTVMIQNIHELRKNILISFRS